MPDKTILDISRLEEAFEDDVATGGQEAEAAEARRQVVDQLPGVGRLEPRPYDARGGQRESRIARHRGDPGEQAVPPGPVRPAHHAQDRRDEAHQEQRLAQHRDLIEVEEGS